MDSKPDRPFRLFVNPVAIWTDLALKTGQALLASAQAAVQSRARVAVIPPADAPAPVVPEVPAVKAAAQPSAAPKVARAKVAKSARAKPRSKKVHGKRRSRR